MASTSAQDRIGWSKYTRWLSATSGSRRFGSGPTGHALKWQKQTGVLMNPLRSKEMHWDMKKETKIIKLFSYQWHDNFFADWIYWRVCNLLAGKKRHFVIRELDCSWSSVFWKDRRDWAPTFTSGHLRFNCTETSLGWLLNLLRGWGMVISGPALSDGRPWQKHSISMILRKHTGLWTVMTIPYKRNMQAHLLPAPSFVGSSNHPCTLFSSIYPNLVFIIVSLNFQTSRSSYSKLRKMFFFFKKNQLHWTWDDNNMKIYLRSF